MSTRSQVIIKDAYDELWFYRHSDGYPSGNMPQLFKFMQWRQEGRIRDNVEQSAGWLIILGAEEYGFDYDFETGARSKKDMTQPGKADSMSGWKVGAYEPCKCEQHGDIEWLYTIDLTTNSIAIKDINRGVTKTMIFSELKKYDGDWKKLEDEFECL